MLESEDCSLDSTIKGYKKQFATCDNFTSKREMPRVDIHRATTGLNHNKWQLAAGNCTGSFDALTLGATECLTGKDCSSPEAISGFLDKYAVDLDTVSSESSFSCERTLKHKAECSS